MSAQRKFNAVSRVAQLGWRLWLCTAWTVGFLLTLSAPSTLLAQSDDGSFQGDSYHGTLVTAPGSDDAEVHDRFNPDIEEDEDPHAFGQQVLERAVLVAMRTQAPPARRCAFPTLTVFHRGLPARGPPAAGAPSGTSMFGCSKTNSPA